MRTLDELRALADGVDEHNDNTIATAAELRMLFEEIDALNRKIELIVEKIREW